MLNHAIYKGCLFYSIGAVEQKAGSTELDKLGGLARTIPITFISCLIAAFAVSGIPPLNGFVSKWMIYQGLAGSHSIWNMIFLVVAMFGSALTLASFLKLIYGVFLGHGSKDNELPSLERPAGMYNDVSWWMLTPMVFLAALCILFGLYAYLPISFFIAPIINLDVAGFSQIISIGTAIWNPTLATALIFIGLIIGAIIYYISRIKTRAVETIFIGGEKYELNTEKILASSLFESIEKIKFLGGFVRESGKGIFDLYNICGDLGLLGVNVLKRLHDGILSTYLAWCIIGLGILCFVLLTL
jgi:NADH:ubiquinone oxidoreductase subunit 5 (subunit L)/multisubunit Na+/H+ antiporter MnhA subunit